MDRDGIAFVEQGLERRAALRHRAGDLAERSDARAVPFWKGKPGLREADGTLAPLWLPLAHDLLSEAHAPPIFLGMDGDAPRFACDVSGWDDPQADGDALRAFIDRSVNRHPSFGPGEGFHALRPALARLSPGDAGDLGTARALMEWHRTHGFCANCGSASAPAAGGWQRDCPACGRHHFPRVDPVVIMLVTHGDDVLLGRSPGWPEGMYSLLAGFVEPGETLEAAVAREVLEETDITVEDVRYVAGQPWPFPSSLMIGCAARATGREITVDPTELEGALWISRERCLASLRGEDPGISAARPGAIARSLLEMWVRGEIS
ncbi:MAG: NAD(+) diphosphatase [Rubricella sp.]